MKGKISTILIIVATIVLAAIAVFTSIRLFQLKQQPVAPNVPASIPAAATECDLDVVLAIDKSRSMSLNPEVPGGTKTKLDFAREAATAFVDKMSTIQTNNQIRIGVTTFGSLVNVTQPDFTMNQSLTSDFNAVKSSIASFPGNTGNEYKTCISCGVKKATEELKNRGETEAEKVIILLSDGCSNITWNKTEVPMGNALNDPNNIANQEAISFANEGKTLGYKFYVVGFNGVAGQSGDPCTYRPETLTGVASDPDSTYYSYRPNASDWAATFESLATKICELPPTPTPVLTNTCILSFTLATPSPTPTATPTATPTPASCNNSCGVNADCETGLICSSGSCRNPSCIQEADCSCPTATPTATLTATPTATPRATLAATPEPQLPEAGSTIPTIVGLGLGLVLLIVSMVLAI